MPRAWYCPQSQIENGDSREERGDDRGRLRSNPTRSTPDADGNYLLPVPKKSGPRAYFIRVEAYDRTGLLSDITQVVAEAKVNILAADVSVGPDHNAIVRATLQVASVSQLARVLARIEQLKDVSSVQRDLG